MATLTSTACQTSASGFFLSPPKYIENGCIARSVNFTFAVSASAGDIVQMVPIPRGASIADVQLDVNGGMGATSNVGFTVGDGNSQTRYLTSSTAGAQTGGGALFRMNNGAGGGYSYSADDTIDVTIGTIGSMSAQLSMRLTVLYSMDQASDGSS